MSNVKNTRMPKDADITMDDARALVADQVLWPRIRDFLWDFAPQIHPSWIDGIPGVSGFSGTLGNPRVKSFILSALDIAPCFHTFPKDDWSRLLLLDGAMLESIAKWLGALACADSLRRMTEGATVRSLKAALPGVYPEVFSFTAYFAKIGLQRKDAESHGEGRRDIGSGSPTAENVFSTGLSIVDLLLAGAPSLLACRLKFKLPKNFCASASLRLKTETCGAVVAKLLKLKFPEAYKLCC